MNVNRGSSLFFFFIDRLIEEMCFHGFFFLNRECKYDILFTYNGI